MIRSATAEDSPDLVSLQNEIEKEGSLSAYVSDSPEQWSKRDLHWTFVAVADARVIGFIYSVPRPNSDESVFPMDGKILEIMEIIIHSNARRQRCGSDLMEVMERQARSEGFTHLRVYSAAKSFDDIVRFYRNHGFKPWYLEMIKDL